MPSHLGPSPTQMVFLFIFIVTNSVTFFALSILLLRNIWALGANVTTIEDWEIERHATLVRRAKLRGGYLDGPDGLKIRIVKHEFPYDVGIFSNVQQGMGENPLTWLWPFAATLTYYQRFCFPTNGFEDPGSSWPPPDPDRMPRRERNFGPQYAFTFEDRGSTQDHIQAFKQRQQEDSKRFDQGLRLTARRTTFGERHLNKGPDTIGSEQALPPDNKRDEGEEAWRNSEGERLEDFGLDEDAEFYDEEDDIPLSQLLLRKKQWAGTHDD